MLFENQTALVTGASRGLGRAIARRLAKNGATVAVNYLARKDGADSLVAEIQAAGGKAAAFQADIGDRTQVNELVERVTAELGPIAILINNAGILYRATLDDFDPAQMERMRRVNVDGLIHITRVVMPGMKERKYGRIVNLTSIAGHGTAMTGNAFYAATKAAVSMMTKRFAMELGPFGITVNAVAPGFILTDMAQDGRSEEEFQAILERVRRLTMTGRAGDPEDIAHAVEFLASPASAYITAQIITVDGGRMDYISHP